MKFVGTRVDATEIFAIGSVKEDYLYVSLLDIYSLFCRGLIEDT